MKLEGSMSKEIAEKLSVSEADVSQTLSRLRRKVKTIQDSTELLMEMGVVQEGPKYVMTEKGRKIARLQERSFQPAQEALSTSKRGWIHVIPDKFELKHDEVSSEALSLIPCGSFVGDKEGFIDSLSGTSEARIGTLDKKTVKSLPTSEPIQRIEAP